MEDSRKQYIRSTMYDHSLSYCWLRAMLEKSGVKVHQSQISAALRGTVKGPRTEQILDRAVMILERYEQAEPALVTGC